MEQEKRTEKFQPRMRASFSKHQLENIAMWIAQNVGLPQEGSSLTESFEKAIEITELDEKGRKMDEKGRKRLRDGVTVLSRLIARGIDTSKIQGIVQVWQTTPDENKNIEIRWYEIKRRHPRL